MLKTAHDITQAQDFLKERYGHSGYLEMTRRLRDKIATSGGADIELAVLQNIVSDETVSPSIRIVATALMGD